ncbi:MAG: acetyl-CoA carboxylase biotin carboxylase subunit, partial [Nitrospiraceae bacterium]
ENEKNISDAFHMAQREALAAFGNGELYIEKYIPEMRHIEVQILADNKGSVVHLGERDCSIQRRHQKLIEESPYIFSNKVFRKKIGELAVKAARAMRYRNAGTVEFIVDNEENIYFMEINTRIQVEHPVTEMITGIDIIKEQIQLAAGEPLSFRQQDIKFSGHSMECRINAEDPDKFTPCPGKITSFIPPGGPGVRVDTSGYSGWLVPAHYDSLIAKLITHGKDREEAIMRMRRALKEFIIEGIKTTIPFYQRILDEPDFLSGNFTTHFLEKLNSSPE